MSFTLPWAYNKFQSSWINNGTAVSGTYSSLSFRNDGNAQLSNTTIIGKASINKAVSATYDLDVAGTINAGNVLINGNAIAITGGALLSADNTFTGNLNTFNANVSIGNLTVIADANIGNISVPGSINANTLAVQNFTFTNVSSAVSVSNYIFDDPYPAAGTTLKYNGTASYTGITNWTFSSTATYSVYQNRNGGSFYTTTRPYSTYLALQTITFSSTATGQSANFSLGKGVYVIKFWLQTQEANTNGRQSFQIYDASNVLLAGLTGLNPASSYPLFVQYDFPLSLSTAKTVYIKFQQATTSASEYVLFTGITIQQTGAMTITDNSGTSVIGGSQSLMNQLYVQNKLSVTSGGAAITGGLNSGTTTGTNNLAINTPFSTTGTNNNTIAIGQGTLQSATSVQRTVAIGVSCSPFNLLTNADDVLIGYGIRTEGRAGGNESYSILIGSGVMTRSNIGYNSLIGYKVGGDSGCMGSYNSGIGAFSHTEYNGFADYNPRYNAFVGFRALQYNRYNQNTAMGANSLSNVKGGNYPAGPASENNTAIGFYSGYNQQILSQCTFLGAYSDTDISGLTRSTAIGYGTIVSNNNTIQLGSNVEDVRMTGNVYMPRQNATLQTALGNINVQSILTPVRYDVQPTYTSWEIWDTSGTGQILSIDTKNNIVEINTTTISAYNMVNTSFESDNFTIISANTVVNGPINITGNLTVAGNVEGSTGFLNMTNSSRIKVVGGGLWNIGSGTTAMKYFEVNSTNNDVAITGNNFTFSADQTTTFNGTNGITYTTPLTTYNGNVLLNSYATTTQLHTFNSGILVNNIQANCTAGLSTVGLTVNTNAGTFNAGIVSTATPASNALTFNTNNTLQCTGVGALTCTASPVIKSQYVNASIRQTVNFTISGTIYPVYSLAPTTNMSITLPTASATYDGARILFRRTGGTTTTTINSASSNIQNLTNAATNVILAASQYSAEIICTLSGAGTYAWYYVRAPV